MFKAQLNLTKNKKMVLTSGVIEHLQMDSHKTQGHNPNIDEAMKKLTSNL